MFVTFMYHRISHTGIDDDINLFQQHLCALKKRFTIIWPGENPSRSRLGACLTFDDSYFDFYHYVFPMLKQLGLKAVLAVPVKYILQHSTLSSDVRLSVPYLDAMQDDIYQKQVPFCTWDELREMQQSGLVKIASHSYSHVDLTQTDCNLTLELANSQQMLADNLATKIDSFVYPFGKMTRAVQKQVSQHYPYSFRIGSAMNSNWQQGLYYRFDGQRFWSTQKSWRDIDTVKSTFKYWQNKLRGK